MKTHQIIISALFVCMLLSCTGIVSAATYSGGSGTSESPYLLSNDSDIDTLSATSADWDKYFTLTNDITLVGNHTPIGQTSPYFTGDFDGNGHSIQNITVYGTGPFVGFFGYIYTGGNIHELGVEASSDGVISTSGSYTGVLAGANVGGTVRDCSATGNVTSSGDIVGGLIGTNQDSGSINNCSATGNVTSSGGNIGGLVGFNANTVFNCSATGNVAGVSDVGGLVGFNNGAGTVSNSFATGTASGSSNVGGLVGSNSGTVNNSFATGTASGSSNVGGLVGSNSGTVNSYCYYSGSPVSGEGISTSYSNFTNFTFVSGATGLNWNESGNIITTENDSSFIWRIDDGSSLPYFQYQDLVEDTPYSGGSGTVDDPYLLSTDEDIDELSATPANWSSYFQLTQNITLVGNHTPIGNYSTKFTGDFNGNGYTIKELTVYETTSYAGFFGYAYTGANIYDLRVEASSDGVVSTGSLVGVLIGQNAFSTVSNCSATGNVTGGSNVAVLIGKNQQGTVLNCSVTGNVSGSGTYIGGLIGYDLHSTVRNCSATGDVINGGSYVGGLVGNELSGTVSNCSATGDVIGSSKVGGLLGYNSGSSVSNSFATGDATSSGNDVGGLIGTNNAGGNVSISFATGTASGSSNVGGLIGNNYGGNVSNSFATGTASGSSSVGGLVGLNSGTVHSYCYYSGSPVSGEGTSTSYSSFTNFTFVSGATGLNWNENSDIITTENDSSFIWRMTDAYTLPYFQYQNVPYSSGSGTSDDPYLLSSDSDVDTLSATSADWDKYFLLTQNITLAGNHTPIGNSGTQFTGDFDGNGYSITNLIVYQTTNYTGLFGYTNTGANIHDLGVETSSEGVVSTAFYVGGLLGENGGNGIVNNCSVTGNVTGVSYVGGILGENGGGGTVSNSFATCNVSGSSDYTGGLAGYNRNTVSNCSTNSTVSGSAEVGGLIGESNADVLNCYATGDVTGSGQSVGGLVGKNWDTISNCYATGNATTGDRYVGGLTGLNLGYVYNSFATGTATGTSNGGLVGVNDGTVTKGYYSGTPVSGAGTSTSYSNFMSFTYVSGPTGLNWNVGGTQDIITTEDDPNYVWKIIEGYTLPYHQYQEDPISFAIPGTPENFTNSTGNFWVNHSWNAGAGDLTDSYNVSYGESWQNSTVTYFNHTGLSAHTWSNITVYAYNATDSILSDGASDNVQVPNNEIGILNVSNITGSEGDTITFDINFTDGDGDTPTFNCNQSSLFDNFNTSTGVGSWDIGFSDAGTYDVEFNVSDGYGSVDSQVITITVSDAATIYVGSGQDDDFTTIQAAINDASQRDTIIVGDGIYNENVVVNKSVTLRSENGSATTNVNASDSSEHALNVTANNVTIEGFNVTGVTNFEMAGIYLGYSNDSIVRNNVVNNNSFGIVLDHSENNTLSSNIANNNSYYGIYLSSSSNNTLTDNTAMNNTRYGMYFGSSDNNTLISNDANYNGRYGIYLSSSNNNTLTDNVASYNTYTYIEPASMSVGSIVEPMDISGGPATGIFIGYSAYNILNGNTASYNEGSNGVLMASNSNAVSPNGELGSAYSCGFSLYNSENITLTGNTAIGNDDYEFYSRSSQNCTIDNLEIDTGSMELSFVPIYETAIRSNETISTGPSGKANVNGYLDIGLLEDMNMTIFYDDSGMSSSIESSVTLYKLNGNEWVAVPNATLNTSGNFVSVNLDSGVSVDIASIADYTSTYGLFKSVPSSNSGSDDDGVRASVSQGQDPKIVSQSASSVKRVTGGSEVNYDFADSGTPVLGVSFDAKDDKGLVVAKVQVLSSNPDGVPAPSGNSYQMMSIDVGSEGTISSDSAENVMIHFKVSKQWIEENDIDISTIRMTRYHGEQWNDLPTSQESEDGEYYYFYAETPGFSVFNVVGDEIGETSEQDTASASIVEEESEPVEEEETPDTPGFTAIAGVVFVSLSVLLRRK